MVFPQVTKKEAGSYRAVVSDKRGEDVSALELLDDGETLPCQQQTNIHYNNSHLLLHAFPLPQIFHQLQKRGNYFILFYEILCLQNSTTNL